MITVKQNRDASEFEELLTMKWLALKDQIESLNEEEKNRAIIRSKKSFKRICYSSVMEFEKTTHHIFKGEEFLEEIGGLYEGGLEKLKSEHR